MQESQTTDDVVLPPAHYATEAMEPSEHPPDFRPSNIAAKGEILQRPGLLSHAVPRDEVDAGLAQFLHEGVAVARIDADECWALFDWSGVEGLADASEFSSRIIGHVDGDPSEGPSAIATSLEPIPRLPLTPYAPPVLPSRRWGATKQSLRSNLPRTLRSRARPWSLAPDTTFGTYA